MNHRKNNYRRFLFLFLIASVIMPRIHAAAPSKAPDYREYTQLEIADLLFDAVQARRLQDSKVFCQGKVIHSPQLKKDEIILYRMVITCCAADAQPFGILVKLPEKAAFQNEEWAGVAGVMQLLPMNEKLREAEPLANLVSQGTVYPCLTAAKAYPVNAPAGEYLYY